MNKQFNIRNLPEHTARQIDELCAKMGMTKTQLVLLAIGRLYQQEIEEECGYVERTTERLLSERRDLWQRLAEAG